MERPQKYEYNGYIVASAPFTIEADQGDIQMRWSVLEKTSASLNFNPIIRQGFQTEQQAKAYIDNLEAE